jgi:hypothetical protein
MIPEILGSAGIAGLVIIVGILIYRAGGGFSTAISTVSVGSNNAGASCGEACTQFNLRRADRCSAAFAEAAARAAMERARLAYAASVAAVVAAAAWAVAAGLGLPWPVNLIVSLALWTVATALTILMIYNQGKLDAAGTKWQAESDILLIANTRVMDARAIVNANCPPEVAAACLNTPNPC